MTAAGTPSVTAVVPTHERPALMARAVQSVVDQTYAGDIEILVVFDASEPVLPELELPANRTVRALVNDRTRGLAGGRNTGILAASHEIVAFLDDDDRWHPEKLTEQVAMLDRSPDALVVGCAMVVDDGTRLHERLLPHAVVTHHELLHDRLAGLHSSSFAVRRSALLGPLGLIDERLPRSYGEDYDLLLRAAAISPVVVVNRPLVTVSWQGHSHFVGRWGDYAAALQFLLAKHPDFATSPRAIGRIEAQVAFALAADGRRADGARWAVRSLRHDPRQLKAWLALVVGARLVDADRVVRWARRFGRGV